MGTVFSLCDGSSGLMKVSEEAVTGVEEATIPCTPPKKIPRPHSPGPSGQDLPTPWAPLRED